MTRHRAPSAPMHADDPVAPGIRRFGAGWITAVGLLLVMGALISIVLVLDQKATTAQKNASLSSDEVAQLRQFLSDRGDQRDAERAAVQAQLDDQRRALCTAIRTLSAAAKPRGKAVLDKAATDLACARLGTVPNTSTSRATSGSNMSTGATTEPSIPRPRDATSRPVTTAPAATLRRDESPNPAPPTSTSSSAPPAPRPATSTPAPRPPIPAAPPADGAGPLEPVTDPICTLTGVCL